MDSYNVNTHLPPRKRLLAELRENSELDFLPPVPFVSGDLGYQLRDVVNSPSSTAQEILEVSMAVAVAAAEIAVAARHTAMEKAAAAAKAKASAKTSLLCLDSIARNRKPGKVGKTRVRKKQIPVELLNKAKHPAGEQKADAELARKLHHAINSSPRISRKKQKNYHNFGKVLCNGKAHCHEISTVLPVGIRLSNNCIIGKSEKENTVCPQADIFGREEELSNCCTAKQQSRPKFGLIASDREVRVKRKTMSLSHYDNIGDQVVAQTLLASTNRHSFTKGP